MDNVIDAIAESSAADVAAESSTADVSVESSPQSALESLIDKADESLETSEQPPVSEDVKPQTEKEPPFHEHPRWIEYRKEKEAEVAERDAQLAELREKLGKYEQPQAAGLPPEGEKILPTLVEKVKESLVREFEAAEEERSQREAATAQAVEEFKKNFDGNLDEFVAFARKRVEIYPGATLEALQRDYKESLPSKPSVAAPSGKPIQNAGFKLRPGESMQTATTRFLHSN